MKDKYGVFSFLSKQKLKNILIKIPGDKIMIIDNNIIKPLENIIGFSELRSLNVEKIYTLQNLNIPSTQSSRQIFLIFSSLISAKLVCDHISSEISRDNCHKAGYVIIVVPCKLYSITQLIEQEGIYEYVTIYSFMWELIPIDNYILSLEYPNFFTTLFTNRDQCYLSGVANSIRSAFSVFGKPSISINIGEYSQIVYNMATVRSYSCDDNKRDGDLDYFIMADRSVDYFSPLFVPATYAGLLDEVFEIQSGFIKLNADTQTTLHATREIYSEIRNQCFGDATSFLKTKAKVVQSEYNRSKNMKLGEIKSYIKNELHGITNLKKSLSFHISACEKIVAELGNHFEKFRTTEESIMNQFSKREIVSLIESYLATKLGNSFSVLRLMCLLCLVNNGLHVDIVNSLKSQFLRIYGYHYATLFDNLERTGLFFSNVSSSLPPSSLSSATTIVDNTFTSRLTQVMPNISIMRYTSSQTTIQKLKLLPTDTVTETDNNKSCTDLSYVFNKCFIPAIPQLVSLIIKNEIQIVELNKIFSNAAVNINNKSVSSPVQLFFIYFIGGVTYAEMAAFQLLEKLTGCQIIVAATNTINGNKLCKWNV